MTDHLVNALMERCLLLDRTIYNLNRVIDTRNSTLELKDAHIQTLTSEVGDLKETIDEMKQECNAKSLRVDAKAARIKTLTSEVGDLQETIQEMKQECNANALRVDAKTARIETLTSEVEDLKETIDTGCISIHEMHKQRQKREQHILELQRTINETAESNVQLRGKLETLKCQTVELAENFVTLHRSTKEHASSSTALKDWMQTMWTIDIQKSGSATEETAGDYVIHYENVAAGNCPVDPPVKKP